MNKILCNSGGHFDIFWKAVESQVKAKAYVVTSTWKYAKKLESYSHEDMQMERETFGGLRACPQKICLRSRP